VLARSPDHLGAIHYYIHAVEASDRPQRAEAPADRLRGAIPGAGHLVHMPSHIYFRLGRYRDALEDNKRAVAADEKYLTETNAPMGDYRLGYYPHNVHFVLVSAQMSGEGETVIAAAEKLQAMIPDAAAREFAAVQPMKVAPYFAHAQFSAPERVLALPEPDKGMPYVVAMWHYARGVALAARGEFDQARREEAAIDALNNSAALQTVTSAGVPAADVLMIASQIVLARVFQAQGNFEGAVDLYEKAAALQDKLPYMEPPYWYYPVRQSLGAALLQAGRLDAAEQEFQLSLRRAPNSAWARYGLAEVYKARGDATAATREEDALGRTWTGDRRLLQVRNL
jgi:tetratricopeptide (TPR) repeat protein